MPQLVRFLFIIIYQGPVFIVWAWIELHNTYMMDFSGSCGHHSGFEVSNLIGTVGSRDNFRGEI